ncbi:hypothetical protein FJZ31_31955 [Candidatus Poribacteria bacterium]|nr:hypothetical protein [Candidatus Poribacteria bacterium]
MGKIENDHQLRVSLKAAKRLQLALEGIKTIPNSDIRQMCEDSTSFMLETIEREIEEYLLQKAAETSAKKPSIQAASG